MTIKGQVIPSLNPTYLEYLSNSFFTAPERFFICLNPTYLEYLSNLC